jgi:NAD(P)-dependent dehydrogenase (short-subunit alcohol dehydrogenase family)
VAVEASVQNAYGIIIATFGRIDTVVASAGILFNFEFFIRSTSDLLGIVHNHTALEWVS